MPKAKPVRIQTLIVRARDDDPCVLWVKGSELPVYRHGKPWPDGTRMSPMKRPKIDCYGDGTLVARGWEPRP